MITLIERLCYITIITLCLYFISVEVYLYKKIENENQELRSKLIEVIRKQEEINVNLEKLYIQPVQIIKGTSHNENQKTQ